VFVKPLSPDARRIARRTLIDFARRRQRPGGGSESIRPLREPIMRWPDMRPVLSGLSWAIAGAVATRRYMAERSTQDLDVVVPARDVAAAEGRMSEAGFARAGSLAIGGSRWLSPRGVPVDLIPPDHAWADEALREAAAHPDSEGSPSLTLPYLVLMKLHAGHLIDAADIGRMLGVAGDDDIELVRRAVRKFDPAAADDIESMLQLGRLEAGDELA
jgi:hypothetical protein